MAELMFGGVRIICEAPGAGEHRLDYAKGY